MTRDRFVTGVTGLLLMMFAAVIITTGITFTTGPRVIALLALILSVAVCGAIAAAAYIYTPTGVGFAADGLKVMRPIGPVDIPYPTIRSVQLSDEWFGTSLKRPPGGNSGFFGIWGSFRSRSLGSYTMFGTRARGAVVLTTTTGTVVLTPDDRERFAEELRAKVRSDGAPGPAPAPAPAPAPPPPPT